MMNAEALEAMGAAIGNAIVAARRQTDEETILANKRNNVRKAAVSAPKFALGQNFNAFKIQYETWRRASGMMETVRVAAVAAADGNPGNNEYDKPIHSAEFQAEQLNVQFTGTAAERIKAISPPSETWNRIIYNNADNEFVRFDKYLQAVQELFMPKAESLMAKQQFLHRKQAPDEDVAAYLSDKITYYNMAYTAEQIAQGFEFLRDKAIEGIYNNVIRKRLIEDPPDNEEELRSSATNFVAQERQKYMVSCSDSPNLDGLRATSRTSYNDVVDMQINAVNRLANKDDECNRCHKKGHFAWECRQSWDAIQARNGNQSAAGMAPAQTSKPGQRGRGKAPGGARAGGRKNIQCRYCKNKGHLESECRKKKAAQEAGQGRGRGRGGGRTRAGVRELDEDDSASYHTALDEGGPAEDPFLDMAGEEN